MVTIKDIAQKLNLNFSSVSRALNNKPGVSDETRALVVKTAREMGYQPNVIARGLVSSVTKTIGVIMPDIVNPVFGEITTGIIETANEADYNVFLCISNWSEKKELDNIYAIQQKQVDGVIIKNVQDANSRIFEQSKIPLVGFETWTASNTFSSVSTDNEKGGYIAAKHLIESGYRKTALLFGPVNSSASKHRYTGVCKAFSEAGRTFDPSLHYSGEYNLEYGYQMAVRLFAEHPDVDSIFAGNDVMAIGILQYLAEQQIIPGKDVGVVGFDNINLSHLPQIQLTTIKQPKRSIGRIMTRLLLEEIRNTSMDRTNFPQRILLEPELIARASTSRR
jgi:LacI family transcriptional regulator